MANRSYLYAIDFDRTKGKSKIGEKVYGLSEYPYSIPLSYKILVSQNAKISPSINWDYEHPIAIQGNFKRGREKLLNFLEELSNESIFDKIELEKQINKTKEFLNTHELENIILECGEIYEMEDDELENQNKQLFENCILNIENQIKKHIKDFKDMKLSVEKINREIIELSKPRWFLLKFLSSNKSDKVHELEKKANNIKEEMWSILGIDYWSDTLYFHHENESTTTEQTQMV